MTWQVVGTSVQGASHIERDIVCQDAHAHALVDEEILIAAVADGAGSADLSHIGSELAATAVVALLRDRLAEEVPDDEADWCELVQEAFEKARAEIVERAGGDELKARRLATTLTCVVVTDSWLAAGQVGDGLAIVEGPEEALHTLIQPQQGEFVSQTVFLTSTGALEGMGLVARQDRIEHVALSTDGMANASTHHPDFRPSEGFFAPLFAFAASAEGEEATAQLEAFLEREALDRLTQDDKTLLVAVREAREEEPPRSESAEEPAPVEEPEPDAAPAAGGKRLFDRVADAVRLRRTRD